MLSPPPCTDAANRGAVSSATGKNGMVTRYLPARPGRRKRAIQALMDDGALPFPDTARHRTGHLFPEPADRDGLPGDNK